MSIRTAAKPHGLCPVLWISLTAACAPLQGTAVYPAELEAQSQATPAPTDTLVNSSAPDKQGTFASEEELELERNTKSCNAGDAVACFHASLAQGRGIAPDDARAVAFLVKACDGGYTPAYSVLADRLAHGKGVSRNEAQAVHIASPLARRSPIAS